MGYTVYACRDCSDSYTADYTDKADHDYNTVVTAPTCTQHGYTTYSCKNCDDEYVSEYTEKLAHKYNETATQPTCTEMGYSIFKCDDCGNSYKGEYTEALGHKPTEWIIDTEATIEHAGSKYIECERCGSVLQTVELAQLVDKDHSDEDGNAKVGVFSIILTDKDGQPVFDSKITIDVNDNVTIKLPSGRLLEYADQTTITAFYTDTQEPTRDLRIFIFDENNNAATGATDENGQLKVPNNQSSTGDDNGTIGSDDGEEKNTFVVTVTDKTNVVIPNCYIHIGESNNIVVDLPDGIKPTRENPVIVTVTDPNGNAQNDITVIAIGDADFMEKGITDIYGKITLPTASEGYTDKDGKVNVDNINVIVNDEIGVIPNAYVKRNEDGTISVTLPENKSISYANRITVTVLDSIGNAMPDVTVTVNDVAEMTYTANTDENGVIVVLPLSEDMTDSEGKAIVNGYNVLITDETQPIENAFVIIADGKISVKLPDGVVISTDNRITATITDKDNAPVKGMSVTVTDKDGKTATKSTDANGKITVPVKTSTGGSGGGSSRPNSSGGSGWGSSVSTPVTSQQTTHKAYIVGYTDSTFRPDGNMTRAEVAAIFARIVSEEKGEKVSGQPKFSDTATDEWYASYIGYIAKYNIVKGYSDGTFRPDEPVTRAELVTMAVRYYSLFNEVQKDGLTVKYTDITSSYWAYNEIAYAKSNGWLNGYADITFRPDNNITRAEVVTVVNHATGRTADKEYINTNVSTLNKFTDLKNNAHWGFYEIMEAANSHKATSKSGVETWLK